MSLIFVVRHGERADNAGIEEQKLIEMTFDPHLTTLGTKQASLTGSFIQNRVSDSIAAQLISEAPPKYLIITSPFLRCVQTAYHIAQSLGVDSIYKKTLHIHDLLCEFLGANFYSKDPLPDVYIRSMDKSLHTKYFDFEVKDGWVKECIPPTYPESFASFAQRVEYGYRYLKDYLKSEAEYKNLIVIMVTHGYGVQVILEVTEQFDVTKDIDYCSVQQIYYPDDNKDECKVLIKQHSEHIYPPKDDIIFSKL